MDVLSDLRLILQSDGAAAQVVPGYRCRESQMQMAEAIAASIASGDDLMVEAGTGTGKTYAYLLPVLLSGKRAIVSTGTRTLQDQLFHKDLPRVVEIAGGHYRFAVLKGRANYLCPHRLEKHLRGVAPGLSADVQASLVRVREWQSRTASGDLGEIMDTGSESILIPLITSTADNCLGRQCGFIDQCPVYRARAKAAEADVVIVNHHLFFSDMALGDENVTPLLPDVDIVVMDEAHQVASIARQFFGFRLGSHQLLELCRDVEMEVRLLGGEDRGVADSVAYFERSIRALIQHWQKVPGTLRAGSLSAGADADPALREIIDLLDLAFAGLITNLGSVRERSRGYVQCYQRAVRLSDLFALLSESPSGREDYAHWVDSSARSFSIHLSPIDIAADFGARVEASRQSWIFTSATLSVSGSFDYVASQLGVPAIPTRLFPSPFDFERQVTGVIPRLFASPGTTEHTAELIDVCLPLLRACRGRSFLLFTTYRALEQAAEQLRAAGDFTFVVQGTGSRAALLSQFREIDRCILLATHSFWEGVDVRGADLRLLVIDKLPFPPPDQPLTRATIRQIESRGGNGFSDHLLPEAITALRQGFGRLIREESDEGLFVLGDTRVNQRGYGKAILQSLPNVTWVTSIETARKKLECMI